MIESQISLLLSFCKHDTVNLNGDLRGTVKLILCFFCKTGEQIFILKRFFLLGKTGLKVINIIAVG